MPRIRPYFIYSPSTKDAAKKLLKSGLSQAQVKKRLHLHCSRSSIGRWKNMAFDEQSIARRRRKKVRV
jgi:hypothetical protein